MTGDPSDLPPCLIFIDKEGRWYHEGAEMIHREFIRVFYQNMELDGRGRYVITWQGNRCYVDVEDTAFVIWRAERKIAAGSGEEERIVLNLSDDTQECLAPETLWVGRDNVLYCKVKAHGFPARFNRPAYYQLARHITEEDGRYFLPLNRKEHIIRFQDPGIGSSG